MLSQSISQISEDNSPLWKYLRICQIHQTGGHLIEQIIYEETDGNTSINPATIDYWMNYQAFVDNPVLLCYYRDGQTQGKMYVSVQGKWSQLKYKKELDINIFGDVYNHDNGSSYKWMIVDDIVDPKQEFKNFLIVSPLEELSVTEIIDKVKVNNRSIKQMISDEQSGSQHIDESESASTRGSVVHEIFDKVLQESYYHEDNWSEDQKKEFIENIFGNFRKEKNPNIVNDYLSVVNKSIRFKQEFMHSTSQDKTDSGKVFKMQLSRDQEWNRDRIYYSKETYGIKGKPDAVFVCDLDMNQKTKKGVKMPIELKTGKKRKSDELQCMLYLQILNPKKPNKTVRRICMVFYYDEFSFHYKWVEMDKELLMEAFRTRNEIILLRHDKKIDEGTEMRASLSSNESSKVPPASSHINMKDTPLLETSQRQMPLQPPFQPQRQHGSNPISNQAELKVERKKSEPSSNIIDRNYESLNLGKRNIIDFVSQSQDTLQENQAGNTTIQIDNEDTFIGEEDNNIFNNTANQIPIPNITSQETNIFSTNTDYNKNIKRKNSDGKKYEGFDDVRYCDDKLSVKFKQANVISKQFFSKRKRFGRVS